MSNSNFQQLYSRSSRAQEGKDFTNPKLTYGATAARCTKWCSLAPHPHGPATQGAPPRAPPSQQQQLQQPQREEQAAKQMKLGPCLQAIPETSYAVEKGHFCRSKWAEGKPVPMSTLRKSNASRASPLEAALAGTGAPLGMQGIPGPCRKAASPSPESKKCSPLPTGISLWPSPGILHSPKRYQIRYSVPWRLLAYSRYSLLSTLNKGGSASLRERQTGTVPRGLSCCTATQSSCPGGLHLLASGIAVSWVPEPSSVPTSKASNRT